LIRGQALCRDRRTIWRLPRARAQFGKQLLGSEPTQSEEFTEASLLNVLSFKATDLTHSARLMTTSDRIVIDPAIAHGQAVIRGTRISVTLVVGSLAGGMSCEDVQREYGVTLEDIHAALSYAAALTQESF